jgi:hypothetical protein
MTVLKRHQSDVEAILDKRHTNGADFWATPNGRWGTGSPFSTFDCVLLLTKLGLKRSDPVLWGASEVLFQTWREDGRFRPATKNGSWAVITNDLLDAMTQMSPVHVIVRRPFSW